MFGIGFWQILIVLLVVLLIFGHRLPALARSLGRSLVEFKKGTQELDDKSDSSTDDQK